MDATFTGKEIAARRKMLGLTQKDLAQKLHVTDKAVSKWERGINFPDLGLMENLAEALDTTPACLLGLENANQEEIVNSITQISNDQLEDARKHLRITGWCGIAVTVLLAAAYASIGWQRTQAYQILGWLMPILVVGALFLLFKYGAIRKWNMGDWLACYGAVIPVIVYNAGYLFMDYGFPDAVNLCLVILSVCAVQLLFCRVMNDQWAKALPVIGLTLYNLWYLANGGVMTEGLICTAVCVAVWLICRRRDKGAKPLPIIKLTAACLVGLALYGFLFYDSLVKAYVNLRHDHLQTYCEALLEENETIVSDRYGLWKVTAYPEAEMVEFHTGGAGFGSQTSYEGFYYSAEDAHIPFQASDAELEVVNGIGWWNDGTDNHGSTQRIRKYFYWFEASF